MSSQLGRAASRVLAVTDPSLPCPAKARSAPCPGPRSTEVREIADLPRAILCVADFYCKGWSPSPSGGLTRSFVEAVWNVLLVWRMWDILRGRERQASQMPCGEPGKFFRFLLQKGHGCSFGVEMRHIPECVTVSASGARRLGPRPASTSTHIHTLSHHSTPPTHHVPHPPHTPHHTPHTTPHTPHAPHTHTHTLTPHHTHTPHTHRPNTTPHTHTHHIAHTHIHILHITCTHIHTPHTTPTHTHTYTHTTYHTHTHTPHTTPHTHYIHTYIHTHTAHTQCIYHTHIHTSHTQNTQHIHSPQSQGPCSGGGRPGHLFLPDRGLASQPCD